MDNSPQFGWKSGQFGFRESVLRLGRLLHVLTIAFLAKKCDLRVNFHFRRVARSGAGERSTTLVFTFGAVLGTFLLCRFYVRHARPRGWEVYA